MINISEEMVGLSDEIIKEKKINEKGNDMSEIKSGTKRRTIRVLRRRRMISKEHMKRMKNKLK